MPARPRTPSQQAQRDQFWAIFAAVERCEAGSALGESHGPATFCSFGHGQMICINCAGKTRSGTKREYLPF